MKPKSEVQQCSAIDCSAYKSSAAEQLLTERGHIDSSHRMIDDTLEYADMILCARTINLNASFLGKLTRLAQSLHGSGVL